MKYFIVTIEGFEESPEGDVGRFAHEEHQLILSEDERYLGLMMFYKGSKPTEIDIPS